LKQADKILKDDKLIRKSYFETQQKESFLTDGIASDLLLNLSKRINRKVCKAGSGH
jgi:hypothetical protein